jgi:hypothetical protein
MAWLSAMRRPSAPRAELARLTEGAPASPVAAGGVAWGALIPEGSTATLLLPDQYPLVSRTVHVGRTVNPLCALCVPLPQGEPPTPSHTRKRAGSQPRRPCHRARARRRR